MAEHGIEYLQKKVECWARDSIVLKVCPFNADLLTDRSGSDHWNGDGKIGFVCHHNGCSGNDWRALREYVGEPGCYDRRDTQSSTTNKASKRRTDEQSQSGSQP